MQTKTFTLPTYLATALINGDMTGLEDSDVPAYEAALQLAGNGNYVSMGDDEWFSWSNDLPGKAGRLGGNVAEFMVLSHESEE
jgi:hypothetical protein